MNGFMRLMGLLSRDMLVMRGYFLPVRNLDGAAQRDRYPKADAGAPVKRDACCSDGGQSDPACAC